MSYVVILLIALLGGFLRRSMGGALKAPRVITLGLMAMLAAFLCAGGTLLAYLLIAVLTAVYWALGHGSYMDMGTIDKLDNERFKPVLDWLYGPETKASTKRDFTGMLLRYTLPAAPVGVVFALAGHVNALWLPVVGPMIALAYLLLSINREHLDNTPRWFDGYTAYGEWSAGIIFYGTLACLVSF